MLKNNLDELKEMGYDEESLLNISSRNKAAYINTFMFEKNFYQKKLDKLNDDLSYEQAMSEKSKDELFADGLCSGALVSLSASSMLLAKTLIDGASGDMSYIVPSLGLSVLSLVFANASKFVKKIADDINLNEYLECNDLIEKAKNRLVLAMDTPDEVFEKEGFNAQKFFATDKNKEGGEQEKVGIELVDIFDAQSLISKDNDFDAERKLVQDVRRDAGHDTNMEK